MADPAILVIMLRFTAHRVVRFLLLSAVLIPGITPVGAERKKPEPAGRPKTLLVGPSRSLKTIGEAATSVKPGDTVVIDPGVYREAVLWKQQPGDGPPITIRGAGPDRTIVDGIGVNLKSGNLRALFQLEEGRYVIEGLTFRNGRNGHNGAGLRLLRTDDTTIRNCLFTTNDMGIMTTDHGGLLIEHSEFSFNGTPEFNGYSHNTYIHGDRVTVRFSYLHDGASGQNFKARTRYIELLYNYIADAHDRIDGGEPTKEVGLQSGKETAVPNSHAVLIGNIIVKLGRGTGFIDFGPEGKTPARNGTLYMAHNTVIREANDGGYVLRLGDNVARAELYNNIFYGTRKFARGEGVSNITGSRNWFPKGADLPNGLKDNILGDDPCFRSVPLRDYRLRPDGACVDRGLGAVSYRNAGGLSASAKPQFHYLPHLDHADRPEDGRPDLGAYELPAELRRAAANGSVTGRITDAQGIPLVRLAVTLRSSALPSLGLTTMTNERGEYRFADLPPGAYKVTPWSTRFDVSPAERDLEVHGTQQKADFTVPARGRIHGRISGIFGGIARVVVYADGAVSDWQLTESDGSYSFPGLPAGQPYSVRPTRSTYTFTPPVHSIERLNGEVERSFEAAGRWLVEGRITRADGTPVEGVMLEVTGADVKPAKSTPRGTYGIRWLPEGGTYVVRPVKPGYRFSPPSVTFEAMKANAKGTHFTAIPSQ
jgi:hypothetical protein